jgi:hypothetical protein
LILSDLILLIVLSLGRLHGDLRQLHLKIGRRRGVFRQFFISRNGIAGAGGGLYGFGDVACDRARFIVCKQLD